MRNFPEKDFFINLRVWNLDEEESEEGFNEKFFELLERHFLCRGDDLILRLAENANRLDCL
jgi:hypothetical protein